MPVDDPFTKTLFHFDGYDGATTIYDESGKTWTNAYNSPLKATQKIFGNTSIQITNASSSLNTPNNADFHFGAGDFTIDYWFRPTAAFGSNNRLCGIGTNTGASTLEIVCGHNTTGVPFVVISNNATNYWAYGPTLPGINTWYHFAAVRFGNELKVAINGVFSSVDCYHCLSTLFYKSCGILRTIHM